VSLLLLAAFSPIVRWSACGVRGNGGPINGSTTHRIHISRIITLKAFHNVIMAGHLTCSVATVATPQLSCLGLLGIHFDCGRKFLDDGMPVGVNLSRLAIHLGTRCRCKWPCQTDAATRKGARSIQTNNELIVSAASVLDGT
jgi:hypothetical protein